MITILRATGPLDPAFLPSHPAPPPLSRPLQGTRLPAGFPSPAEEYLDGMLDLHEYLVRNRSATFYFRVSGLSMLHAGILDGDILAVDRSIEPKHAHIVVAAVDGEFTVKRLWRRAGVTELRPENPVFEPIRFVDGQELVVWGVVVGVVRRTLS